MSLADVLDAAGTVVRTVDIPATERTHVLEAVGRLRIDLDELTHRLGVNGTPQPSKPPTPPPPPPPER
jgi:hypothetical protein